jgi:hypothetical protein
MEPSISERHLKRKIEHEKLKRAIRLLSIISLFLIFCAGIFFQDGSIYANEKVQDSQSTSVFVKEIIPERDFAPKTVTIRGIGIEKKVLVYSSFASDILKEANIILDSDDEILPSKNAYIPNKGVIVIVEVESKIFVNTEAIKYKSKTVEDNTMDKGKSIVDVKGTNGVLEKTIRVIYKDSVAFSSEIIDTRILIPSITQVVRVGTKVVTIHNCVYWANVVNDMVQDERERRWLKSIMYWESGCDSGSNIEKYFEGSKGFYGLFQFTPKTFYELFGGTNIWDGYNQIEIAHKMYNYYHDDVGLSNQWPTNKLFLKYYGDKYGPKD